MRAHDSFLAPLSPFLAFLCLLAVPALAEDEEKELGWKDEAELTFVVAGGNSETSTLGINNTLQRVGETTTFTLGVEVLRAESTTITRTATGTVDDFVIQELEETELTAERYALAALFDREITDRLFFNTGLEGLRNELAGIDSRWVGQVGLGHVLVDREGALLKTRYGVTWTREEDLAGFSDDFLGLRLGTVYEKALNEPTSFGGSAIVDVNLDETDDLRAEWANWLAVSMTERLALKLSLRLNYDAEPAFVDIPLLDLSAQEIGLVRGQLDELDTLFQTALIIKF